MKHILLAALTLMLLSAGLQSNAQENHPHGKEGHPTAKAPVSKDAAVINAQLPSYPLDTCVVTGKKFSAEKPAVDVVVNGRLIRVCCSRCETKVKENSADAVAKIDAAVIKAQKPLWLLKACPVSGEAMGSMGEPLDFVVGTRYVQLCCKGCTRAVKKDPAAFLKKLDAKLMPELIKSYPTKTCVVSGEALGSMGDSIDMMYGHRLVRLCCKGCLRAYKKDPAAIVAKIYK
jgi:hypothetical protein